MNPGMPMSAGATTDAPADETLAAAIAELQETCDKIASRVARVGTLLDSVANDVLELLIRGHERDELTRAILRHPAGRRLAHPVTPVISTSGGRP